jgi:hypothetical protein
MAGRRWGLVGWIVSMAIGLAGCASPAPDRPVAASAEGSGIGVHVRIVPALGPAMDAQAVFFVGLGPDLKPTGDKLYISNFSRDGRAYLLDVPEGRYAAVAGTFSQTFLGSKDTRIIYFPQSVLDRSASTTRSGAISYAGSYVIGITMPGVCPSDSDAAQLRYAELIAPGVPKCGLVNIALHQIATQPMIFVNSQFFPVGDSIYHHRGSLRDAARGMADESDFRSKAGADLGNTGWLIAPR